LSAVPVRENPSLSTRFEGATDLQGQGNFLEAPGKEFQHTSTAHAGVVPTKAASGSEVDS